MTSSNFDLGKGLPSAPMTLSPLACKYAMISVNGLRLIAENGKFFQSFISVVVAIAGEVTGDGFDGVELAALLLLDGAAVVAKNAFSRTDGSNSAFTTAGGGLSGGLGFIGVVV